MENDYWITTEQMVKNLQEDPDNEHEYRRYLGGILRSTHWFVYNSRKRLFAHSYNIEYDWYTKEELLDSFKGAWWHRDV